MISIFRQNQRVLMLVVAILTIIAFAWLYNPAQTDKLGSNRVATAYGRNLTQADVERQVKIYHLARIMQQLEFLGTLGGMAQNEDQAVGNFVLNLLVLRHEAGVLGVRPTDAQVAARLQENRHFQTDGRYDPAKYNVFLAEQLLPRRLAEADLWDMMRDVLRLERIREIVTAPVGVGEAAVADAAKLLQKVDLGILKFPVPPPDDSIVVTDEEVAGFYERNRNTALLTVPETRQVAYVEFALPEGTPDRVEGMQKLADEALKFVDQMQGATFEAAAQGAGLAIQTSPAMDAAGRVRDGSAAGEKLAPALREVAQAAFLLGEQNAVSDVVQAGDKFFVLKLVATNPQRVLSQEEARPLVLQRLRELKAADQSRERAEAAILAVRAALAGGKSFADAATAAGVTFEEPKALDIQSGKFSPDQAEALRASLLMEPGQLSGYYPAPVGGMAVFLAARAPVDAAALAAARKDFSADILASDQQVLFYSWLNAAREASKAGFLQPSR